MGSHAALGGHPIHPMLVAFPIAFLVMVPIIDLVYFRTRDQFWARVSYIMLLVGVVWAPLAAIPGFIDYLTIPMVSEATWHLAVGLALTVFSLVHLLARKPREPGSPPRVLFPLGVIGVLLVMAQGYLGGDMVYRWHVAIAPKGDRTDSAPEGQASSRRAPGAGGGQSTTSVRAPRQGPSVPSSASLVVVGEKLFAKRCSGCHMVRGQGGDQGPGLSHEGTRHDRAWIAAQIKDPSSHNANAQMPVLKMSEQERNEIADYVASLK